MQSNSTGSRFRAERTRPQGGLGHCTASDCVTRRTSGSAPAAAAAQLSLAHATLPLAMYSLRPAMVTAAQGCCIEL